MVMWRSLYLAIFLLVSKCTNAKDEVKWSEECTITHPSTGEFYDLRGLARHPDEDMAADWHANAYDYTGGNFSLNICAPLITKTTRISRRQNISAIYTNEDEKVFSIGQTSTQLHFRGKKLVLEYGGGSDCPGNTDYHKSSLILFTCDQTMVGTASVNFIGESNECAYFFEYKTSRACATTRDVESAISPGMVFLIILLVAFIVYLIGGCMYSRTVLHQTGWRQVPNYELWGSIFGFVGDIFVIVVLSVSARVSSLLMILGLRRKGRSTNTDTYGRPFSSESRIDADNQLIDDLEDDAW